jgi:cyclomaltodextrinase / maltogenic alpha-amylase / neopullulanase
MSISTEAARRLRPAGPYHLPPAAQPIGSWVDLVLESASSAPEVILRDVNRDVEWRVMMAADGDRWTARIKLPSVPTIVRYHFEFANSGILYEMRQTEGRNKPIYGEWEQRPFQIAAYDPQQAPPRWSAGTVFYQIFPDRFANGDTSNDRVSQGVYGQKPIYLAWGDLPEHPPKGRDFYGGDLRGLIERLDYLADLGVECVYLCPIFASPTNHRYDALDYFEIDPMLGTERDFEELVEKAHARSIRIILDAVYNHCSSDSKYFNRGGHYGPDTGATKSQQSPYYRWFSFKRWPDEYDGWAGLDHMPEFVECPEVEDHFIGPEGVSAYWLKKGIDGWRTDVTRWVTDEFWRRFRRAVRAVNPEAYLVAEEWEDATHYLVGDMYDASMNYRFAWALHGFLAHDKLSASELDDRLETWRRDTPAPWILSQMNLIDSHDTWRALTTCERDRRRFKQMVAFQLAYPGAPMIYYGDEAGLEGDYAESARRAFPWDHIDQDLHGYYKRALAYRRSSNALRVGSVEAVVIDDARCVYAFARRADGQSVYAVFNASDEPVTVEIPLQPGEAGHWKDALGQHTDADTTSDRLVVRIEPRGAAWYGR